MNTEKIIHYCWFGPKPLSKLTLKCMESWKKYLPDYEIKLWNEENVDLTSNKFVKEAYENKKWAFVADYARLKGVYEHGGIYLDTDMEITKDISKLLEDNLFLGIEDSKLVNAAIIYAKEKHNSFIKKMIDSYDSLDKFDKENIYSVTIPAQITSKLLEYGLDKESNDIQKLDDGNIVIYPREYFYPLSYDFQNNVFTENTCMIHHFDATWTSKQEQIKMFFIRRNMRFMVKVIDICLAINRRIKKLKNKMFGNKKSKEVANNGK